MYSSKIVMIYSLLSISLIVLKESIIKKTSRS